MLSAITKHVSRFVSDNATTILTAIGASGVVATAIAAVASHKRAERDIWDAESEFTEKIDLKEKIRLTWHHYIPPVVIGGASIAAIIGSHTISKRRHAALVSLYALSEKALKEYQDKVKEKHGEEAHREIKEEIARDHVMSAPMVNSPVIITGTGKHLIYDHLSSRYFRSTVSNIQAAVNEINRRCMTMNYATKNEFYALLGLDTVMYGDEEGWRVDTPLDVEFTTILTEDEEPCIAIEYHGLPVRDYNKEAGRY